MQCHRERKKTKNLVLVINEEGNWETKCNGQKTLRDFHAPVQHARCRSHVILCNNAEEQSKQNKTNIKLEKVTEIKERNLTVQPTTVVAYWPKPARPTRGSTVFFLLP